MIIITIGHVPGEVIRLRMSKEDTSLSSAVNDYHAKKFGRYNVPFKKFIINGKEFDKSYFFKIYLDDEDIVLLSD